MPAGPASRSTPASREARYAPGTPDDGLRWALLSGMPPAMRAKVSEALDAVDRALAPARARYEAADPGSRALRPAELDWAEPSELEALAAAHAGLRTALGDWNSPKAAMARVEAKRARRRRRQATEARALAGGRS